MFLCKDAQPASSSLADGKYFLQLIKKKKKKKPSGLFYCSLHDIHYRNCIIIVTVFLYNNAK